MPEKHIFPDVILSSKVDRPDLVEVKPIPSVLDSKIVQPLLVAVTPLSGIQKAGVFLAASLLFIIGAVIAALIFAMIGSEFVYEPQEIKQITGSIVATINLCKPACSAETQKFVFDLMAKCAEIREASRDFWVSVGSVILINVLLPVLTSILGYIFGTSRAGKSEDD